MSRYQIQLSSGEVLVLPFVAPTPGEGTGGETGGDCTASGCTVDTTDFDNNLSSADDTTQKALDTLDDLTFAGAAHSHSNKSTLDAITASYTTAEETKLTGIETAATADQTDGEIETAYNNQVSQVSAGEITAGIETDIRRFSAANIVSLIGAHESGASHSHSNKSTLDAITASYTTAEETKLTGIETAATADQTDGEIETAYNNQVSQVSAGEITAGTATAIRRFSVADIVSIVDTHETTGGGGSSVWGGITGTIEDQEDLVFLIDDAIDAAGLGTDGDGWTGASYNAGTGIVTFTSADGLGFTTGDLRGSSGGAGTDGTDGTDGADGDGWTGASYNAGTGIVTFTSADGLGFTTGDLRGADGIDGGDGSDGTNGTDGIDGDDGAGVAAGGTAGQVLSKIDGTDFNTQWIAAPSGGGISQPVIIDNEDPAEYGILIQGHATQSVGLLRAEDSAGNYFFHVSQSGTTSIASVSIGSSGQVAIAGKAYSAASLAIKMNYGSGANSGIYGYNNVVGFAGAGADCHRFTGSDYGCKGYIGLGNLVATSASCKLKNNGGKLSVQNAANARTSIQASTLNLDGVPTSDPTVAGDLWNDSGTLKISAG